MSLAARRACPGPEKLQCGCRSGAKAEKAIRSGEVPEGFKGTTAPVWAGTERRKDPVIPVWALRPAEPGGAWGREAGVVHLSGFPACDTPDLNRPSLGIRPAHTGGRRRKKLQEIKQQLRRRMHDPVAQVGGWLRSVLNGYYQYHAIPGNLSVLSRFRRQVARYWFHVLGQRSQRRPTWEKLGKLFDHWLPVPHVVHSCISRRAFRRQPPSGGTSEVRTVCGSAATVSR